MDDDQHLAFAVLGLCDALEPLLTPEPILKARKHAHAVLSRYKATTDMEPDVCRCPEDGRPECNCHGTCICTAP
jgi:hypothetical protein